MVESGAVESVSRAVAVSAKDTDPGEVRGSGSGQGYAARRRVQRRRQMWRLVASRLAALPLLLVAISAGIFFLASVSPLDPLATYLGDRYQFLSQSQRNTIASALQLNQSWGKAWATWAGDVLHGDLGFSRTYNENVGVVLAQRLPPTLVLSATGLVLAFLAALALAFLALRFAPLNRIIRALTVTVQAVPPFVLALGAILIFAVGTQLLPAGGRATPGSGALAEPRYLLLPAAVLALTQLPWLVLTLLERTDQVLASDSVRGAVQRGIPTAQIIRREVLWLSVAPTVTMLGMRLPELIVGAVLVEEVFSWGGVGEAMVKAAQGLDLALLSVLTIAAAALVIVGNLGADLLYLRFDPRVSYAK